MALKEILLGTALAVSLVGCKTKEEKLLDKINAATCEQKEIQNFDGAIFTFYHCANGYFISGDFIFDKLTGHIPSLGVIQKQYDIGCDEKVDYETFLTSSGEYYTRLREDEEKWFREVLDFTFKRTKTLLGE